MRKHALTVFTAISFTLIATIGLAQTAITSLPYSITTSGSYYISGNLTSTGNGISITASDVTIDFGGYTISGNGSSGYGVYPGGTGYSNIEIRGGGVRSFAEGISFDSSWTAIRIIDMRVIGNVNNSIQINGTNILVKDCTIEDNGYGPVIGGVSVFTGNTTCSNDSYGLSIGANSTITNNVAYNNNGTGIIAGSTCVIIGNSLYNNASRGISGGTSTIKNNSITGNGKEGIDVDGSSYIDGNMVYNNNQDDGGYLNISTCTTCTLGTNYAP